MTASVTNTQATQLVSCKSKVVERLDKSEGGRTSVLKGSVKVPVPVSAGVPTVLTELSTNLQGVTERNVTSNITAWHLVQEASGGAGRRASAAGAGRRASAGGAWC